MSVAARSLLIGGILLAAYYALIFGYAARARAERAEHVLWRFPLQGQSDLCADPLEDGGVVCSDHGKVIVVGPDGKERARYVAYDLPYIDRSPGYESAPFAGYQWIGGTKDSLTLVSVAKPPMDQLYLVAMESEGAIRWEKQIEPGLTTSWITCTQDSIFVQSYKSSQQRGADSVLQRFSLDGELNYSTNLKASVGHVCAADDNSVYLLDNAGNAINALDPEGKLQWSAKDAVSMPLRCNFVDGKTVYYLDTTNQLRAVGEDGKERFRLTLPAPGATNYGGGFALRELLNLGRGYQLGSFYGTHDKARVADAGDIVYVINGTALIAANNTGRLLWTKDLPSLPMALAASPDGTAYVALTTGGLAAYGRDGKEKWRNASIRNFTSLISIGPTGNVFVEADNELICFAP